MPVSTAELSYASLGGKPIISIRSAIEAFTQNGWDLSLFMGKANSFRNSIGEESGGGFVLMAADTLNTLNTSTPLKLVFGQGGSDESIELWGIYIRTATRITPGASQSTGAIYLVELVDTRYYLRRKLINKRYNCRYLRDTSSSYVTATTNSGTPWTWAQVITDLWNANSTILDSLGAPLIGGIGTLPDLTDLTSKPENLRYEGVSAWEALNDACRRCGCAVVLDNAFVNNFFVVRLGVIAGDTAPSFFNAGGTNITKLGAEATFSASPTTRPGIGGDGLFVDAEVLQGDSMIPKTIVVMYPTEFGGSQIRDELESTYGKWYPIKIDGSDSAVLPYHIACEFHDTAGDARRIPRPNFNSGSELIRYELTTARFSSSTDVDPSNKTDLTTRAKEVARDIYRTIHDCAIAHVGYMGIKFGADANPTIPGKTLTTVAWGDLGQGFRTDFYRSMPRMLPDEPYLIPQPGATESGGSSGGGSGGSSGCCCNPADCVDLCEAIDSDVVTTCTNCPSGALRNYTVSIGKTVLGLQDPIVGFFTLMWDSACTWKSATLTAGAGTYRLVLVVDATLPYIEVQHVSGVDTLKVNDGYHSIRWNFTGSFADYSCLCNMQFKLVQPNKVYKPKGLNSLICMLPLEVGGLPPSCPKVPNTESGIDVVPCLPSFTFPELTGAMGLCGYSGSTNVAIALDYVIDADRQCPKEGTTILVAPSHPPDTSDQVSVSADIWYAGGQATLTFLCNGHSVAQLYTLASGSWVIGVNTLTRSGASTMYPATITVTLTDCNFSSTHPDYGYGCGGSSGGGSCSGGCIYHPLDKNGVVHGSGGPPFTWGLPDPASCTGAGCHCPDPPALPPTGIGDFFAAACVTT